MRTVSDKAVAVFTATQLSLLVMAWHVADRVGAVRRDDRGDAGGKGVILLIAAVIGIGVLLGVGLLMKGQIDDRKSGLTDGGK